MDGHGARDVGGERRVEPAPPRTVYELSEVDRGPSVITKVDPLYPSVAREKQIEGRVILRFIITKDGRVIEPTVVEGEPPGVFDNSALDAIRGWRFNPGIKNGKPVDVIIVAPLTFGLVR